MSVYGKKIVIDDVEYVAVPDKGEFICSGCAFGLRSFDVCEKTMEAAESVMGAECTGGRYILKKVTPKKKPDPVDISTRDRMPSLQRRELNAKPPAPTTIHGTPYLNPTQMMMKGQSVLIDDAPYLIAKVNRTSSGSQTIDFVRAANEPSLPRRCFGDYGKTPLHGAGYTPTKEPPTQYIVCLSESGNLAPSENPKQHDNELAATKEAQRLCRKHNQKFVVLKVVAEVEPEIQTKVTKR